MVTAKELSIELLKAEDKIKRELNDKQVKGIVIHPRQFQTLMVDPQALNHVTLDLKSGHHRFNGYPLVIDKTFDGQRIIVTGKDDEDHQDNWQRNFDSLSDETKVMLNNAIRGPGILNTNVT